MISSIASWKFLLTKRYNRNIDKKYHSVSTKQVSEGTTCGT